MSSQVKSGQVRSARCTCPSARMARNMERRMKIAPTAITNMPTKSKEDHQGVSGPERDERPQTVMEHGAWCACDASIGVRWSKCHGVSIGLRHPRATTHHTNLHAQCRCRAWPWRMGHPLPCVSRRTTHTHLLSHKVPCNYSRRAERASYASCASVARRRAVTSLSSDSSWSAAS
jgi:hypothetical protein